VYAQAFAGNINWLSGTINVLLCTSSYTPSRDSHVFLSDITNELATGSYARVTVSGKAVNYVAGVTTFTASDAIFPLLTGTFRYAIVFQDTGTAGTSPLLYWINYGVDESVSGQDARIGISSVGAFALTAN
jgi:hypothetical protein